MHRSPQVYPCDRAARAFADIPLKPDHHGGAVCCLFQPRGDDAHDAGVPALGGGPDEGALNAARFGLRHRIFADEGFDLAAFVIAQHRGLSLLSVDIGHHEVEVFNWSRRAASAVASAALSVERRRAPISAWPMRPPALTRGPSTKPSA